MLNKNRDKVKYWRCRDWSCTAFVHTDGKDNYKAHYESHDGYLPSPEQIQETRKNNVYSCSCFSTKICRQNNFGQLSVDKMPIRQKDCRPKIVD